MIKNYSVLSFLAIALFIFTGCDKDDPEITNEEELITTVNYTLTDEAGATVVLTFTDLDGDGGNDATIVGGTLVANQRYLGTLELLNEAETPSESVNAEISEEAEEHQFFFESNIADLSFEYLDVDADGNPIGINGALTTGDATSGSITITLRHEPNKTADGVSDGDISNAGGETDIEVTFPIVIE